jgi:hypothetical protein
MEIMDYAALDRHNKIALQEQPELSRLVKLCERLSPGSKVVLRIERDLAKLLKRYNVIKPSKKNGVSIHFSFGKPNNCHGNIAALWRKSEGNFTIATGYSMLDGIWRQHSFGMLDSGDVLETTAGRMIYMGYPLNDEEASIFTLSELGPTSKVASFAGLGGLGSIDRRY